MTSHRVSNARERRKQSTVSEGLLWSILRARQLCNLKFRREHPIDGFIADFACEEVKLVIEIDGGYHDQTGERDIAREKVLRELGWDVVRFIDKDVEQNAEAVGRAIAKHLGLEYSLQKLVGGGSGLMAQRGRTGPASAKKSLPSPRCVRPSQGEGEDV